MACCDLRAEGEDVNLTESLELEVPYVTLVWCPFDVE